MSYRGSVGKVNRPLLQRLKARFGLNEEAMQVDMHVGDCVYPMTAVDKLLGLPKTVVITTVAGVTGLGATGAVAGNYHSVPVGKRWTVTGLGARVVAIGGGLAVVAWSAIMGGGGASILSGVATLAAATTTGILPAGIVMDAGDQIGLFVVTLDATETMSISVTVFEENFGENVV